MKINVCAGRHLLEGWTNVDAVVSTHPKAKGRKPDILADMASIPLPDECADELMCIHGIEHVYSWEAEDAIKEWHRLLKVGGKVVIECPDLIKCCKNLLSGYKVSDKHPDQMGMYGIYGDHTLKDPFMMHKNGWTPTTMRALLDRHGFTDIQEERPQWHAAGASMRDMRMVARKA
jgi:predicted SAM-dependent methyltransferase